MMSQIRQEEKRQDDPNKDYIGQFKRNCEIRILSRENWTPYNSSTNKNYKHSANTSEMMEDINEPIKEQKSKVV